MSDYISDAVQALARKVMATPLPPLFSPRPEGYDDVHRRAVCLTLARKAIGGDSSVFEPTVYDAIAAADYLDRGYVEDLDAVQAAEGDSELHPDEAAPHPYADLSDIGGKAAEKTGYTPTDLRG